MFSKTTMIVMADEAWTTRALLTAFAIARQVGGTVTLLRMIPVTHPGHLGTSFGYMNNPKADADALNHYRQMAAGDVDLKVVDFQYISRVEAICDAAEQLDAKIVLTSLPDSRLPYLHALRTWLLKAQLRHQGRTLISSTPALVLQPFHAQPRVRHAHRH